MPPADGPEPLTRCQSDRDGDCYDKRCPQKQEYRIVCPLYEARRKELEDAGYE